MKNKLFKKLAVLTCVAALGIATPGMTTLAASMTSTIRVDFISAHYYYGKAGHQLKMCLTGYTVNEDIEEPKKLQEVTYKFGNHVDIYDSMRAEDGRYFILMTAEAYVDGTKMASIRDELV